MRGSLSHADSTAHRDARDDRRHPRQESTEQNGLADESKSIVRQVEHARIYAGRKGWTVDQAHVYIDDGVSGALFGASRPGLARLLAALTPPAAQPRAVLTTKTPP